MPPAKTFHEKLEAEISRLDSLELGNRSVNSIIKKLNQIKDRLKIIEDNNGIKRTRMSNSDKPRKVSDYQKFVKEMTNVFVKQYPDLDFVERSKLIAEKWREQKNNSNDESDFNSDMDSESDMPKSQSKPKKAKSKPKSKPKSKDTEKPAKGKKAAK